MVIDWESLAVEIGSISDSDVYGGSEYAQRALEKIIGSENIARAVETAISLAPGSELAMNVLRHIKSREALELAYREYKSNTGERAALAVWLIKHIGHPHALNWVEEFLSDDNVAGWGIGVLDQLLFTHTLDPDDEVVHQLLDIADQHQNENVREQAQFIRDYLKRREVRS